ncbi:MAG: DUF3135 domain-containing protein [Chromatiales bacterium]
MDSFDELVHMAKHSPLAFESYRADLIEELIGELPPERQLRMRRLQWRIDQERKRHPNELASCIKLINMMMESFDRLHDHFITLDQILGGHEVTQPEPRKARVLHLADATAPN